MKTLLEYFPFLASNRFWAVVIMAIAIYAGAEGYIPKELVDFIALVCGSHVGIRTLDKLSESIGKRR